MLGNSKFCFFGDGSEEIWIFEKILPFKGFSYWGLGKIKISSKNIHQCRGVTRRG